MLDDSSAPLTVDQHALPTLLVSPRDNRVLEANTSARALFQLSEQLSELLVSDAADAVVFFDAVAHFGRYADRTLELRGADARQLRLQTFGVQLDGPKVLLSFLDLNDLDQRNRAMEHDAHQKGGLMQWRNIYGFFQEVEAQNHLILEAAGEGIYGINAEGKATFVNRAAQEMLGWSAEDLIGRDLHATIHHKHLNGEHFPAHECPIYASFRNDETMRVDDDVFWRKDGKPIMVEYVSTPIYDHNILAGAVVIFRDVTERRENERKLRDALAQVEELKVKLEQENEYLLTEVRSARSHAGVVGVSDAIKSLNAQIDLAAKNNAHVLVSGPPGSGKSLTVSAIHEASTRQRRPLVRINCSETNVQALETELFGHKRGAFPGATRDQTGKFLMANNSTLHLDEVADLPKSVQAKLHDVLQSGHFQRPGDASQIPINLTVVATTSRDLAAEVRADRFRQDLYFTLNLFSIRCTPLCHREEDIPYLAKHFLDRTTRRLRLPENRLTRSNIQALEQYAWPGNVRELENVIERAAILAQGGRLEFDFQSSDPLPNEGSDVVLTAENLRDLERTNLQNALKRSQGKVSGKHGAAAMLGLAPTTVYSKIKSLDIDAAEFK
ncbi:sigma 54-interacting transcriptional regulator [Tateyamaria sp. ANG-S1]|uniref:sigma-54 interaction domain-containing protein n=1 Tax=Tateyamaria sp. ANG-S1 TaxID=1577905 RepID=UPI00057D841B|nr:sigma 54-interacting transcriptional regulator [Tateyamaria sp. ANG-S1]KIC47994.1 histidine kinase [Tateyamaria sp. ANG-S1]